MSKYKLMARERIARHEQMNARHRKRAQRIPPTIEKARETEPVTREERRLDADEGGQS